MTYDPNAGGATGNNEPSNSGGEPTENIDLNKGNDPYNSGQFGGGQQFGNEPSTPPPVNAHGLTTEETNWGIAAHLAGFVAAYVGLGVLGPLVVYLVKGDSSPFVRANAVEAINFNITVLIGLLISGVLTLLLIGFLGFIAIGIAYLVFSIMAALAAKDGQVYTYPFTIRFMK